MTDGNLPSTEISGTQGDGNLPATTRRARAADVRTTPVRKPAWPLAPNERLVPQYGPEWVKHALAGGTIRLGNILVDD